MKRLTSEQSIAWYRQSLAEPLAWTIEHEGKYMNEPDRRAKFAIGIADTNKIGKGLGTEATQLILDYAFNSLKLHRVDLRVLEYNRRAIRCYKKCGLVREVAEREGTLVEGNWETDVMMSVLEQEYRAQPSKEGRIRE